jgi:hypothetical protein
MKLYFDYRGSFRKYDLDEVAFDYIQFYSGDTEYIIDTTGELDISFDSNSISGRFKGFTECLEPEVKMSEEEIADVILKMDTSTFKIGLFEEEDEPDYDKLDIHILTCKGDIAFSVTREERNAA